jgi:hypothetical protein
MTMLIKSHPEKFLLVMAGGLLLLSVGWSRWRGTALQLPLSREDWSNEEYQPATRPVIQAIASWEPPVAQSAGAAWIFEVFGPPTIHRDPNTGEFTAGISSTIHGDRPSSEVTLLAIHAAPYRVQLQGCFSQPDGQVVAFAAESTREIWFARPGERWAAQGVVLEQLDPAGFVRATLRDERTGQQVILVAGEKALTDELLATLWLANNSTTRTLREGDAWVEGEVTYHVDRLSLNPAMAAIVRIDPDRQARTMLVLRLDKPEASGPATALRAESPSFSLSSHNGP